MGKGLMMRPYYQWFYIAIIITFLSIPLHLYMHIAYATHSLEAIDLEGLYISLLLLGNIIVFAASIKYWWWLKKELIGSYVESGNLVI